MNRKTWIIIALIVALAVFLILIFAGPNRSVSYKRLFSNDEAKGLLDLNQVAIAQGDSASSAAVIPFSDDDHILGTKTGKIKVIVYENPNDLYSAELANNLNTLMQENEGQIALAVRYYFPKTDSLAWQNAVALECAGKNGKYNEARTWLMGKLAKQETVSWEDGSRELGLNINTCLKDQKIKTAIEMSLDRLKDAPVYGAPTLFIGSEIITGSRSLDDQTNSAGENLEGLRNVIKRQLGA
ncbi:MAG TPA: thioredoxin domain-containing protein [bacterium]|nr:thioredoxin domain-containing protein [bacterium]HPT29792.1 thioredoxin domain-containing protein [bacterium]